MAGEFQSRIVGINGGNHGRNRPMVETLSIFKMARRSRFQRLGTCRDCRIDNPAVPNGGNEHPNDNRLVRRISVKNPGQESLKAQPGRSGAWPMSQWPRPSRDRRATHERTPLAGAFTMPPEKPFNVNSSGATEGSIQGPRIVVAMATVWGSPGAPIPVSRGGRPLAGAKIHPIS